MGNKNLSAAKEAKKDEFYTQLEDINKELKYYREHFRGKTVLCNCDDPRISNFFTYFAYNFEFLGLKRLITTCYKNQDVDLFSQNKSEQAVYLIGKVLTVLEPEAIASQSDIEKFRLLHSSQSVS